MGKWRGAEGASSLPARWVREIGRALGGRSYSTSAADREVGTFVATPAAVRNPTVGVFVPFELSFLTRIQSPRPMEFFEFVLVFSMTVLLPLTIFKTVMDYKKSQLEAERGVGENTGFTVGELKKMLAEVVREANEPLLERIEELERERGELPSPRSRDLFVGVEAEKLDVEEDADKTLGRRVRG